VDYLIGRHRYIVPLFAVCEMFRPAAESIFTVQNRQEVAMVRERLLSVLRPYRRFGVVPRTEDPCQALLIVAESEGQPFCLMVDDLIGKQEVVIKSLGEGLGERARRGGRRDSRRWPRRTDSRPGWPVGSACQQLTKPFAGH
jgi:chemotaxis protein histidine kinase CheA